MRLLAWVPLLAACAAQLSYTRPNLGKKKFYEVTTPHVVLISDMAADDAEELGESLEGLWISLADNYELVAPGQPRPTQLFRTIIFASCEDFNVFRPHEQTAAFVMTSRDYQERPIIVGCREERGNPRRIFLHELAHAFNHHFFARLPPWLEEGLAQYYETLQIRRGQVTLGLVPLVALAHRRDQLSGSILVGDMSGRLPTFEEIMAMTPLEFYGRAAGGGSAQHYAGAWVLVHLLNGSKEMQDRFVLYLSQLAAGQPLDAAWERGFGDVPRAQLAGEYAEYINRAELMYWKSDYKRPDADKPKVRRLRAGEAHAVWIDLLLATKHIFATVPVHEQLDTAERDDPGWSGVPFWRAMAADVFGETDVDAHLRRAADADPEDRLSRLALLRRAVASEGADLAALDADAKLLEAKATSGMELATVALFWTRRGQPLRAVPLAARAVQIDRGCSLCFEAAAMSLASLGKPAQAVSYQERAVALIERREGGADASEARKRLEAYQEAAATRGK